MLLLIAGWALFAFAGAYRWTVVPILAGAGIIAALVRPAAFRAPHRTLDFALAFCLSITALQLAPLPPDLRSALSPSAGDVDRALLFGTGGTAPRPISLDPQSTIWALAFGAALLLTFWSARASFARGGGLRLVCRGIAWLGFALAIIMFVQRAMTPGLIYGFWHPITRASHPTPLGPFVNRNDIATWLMMAAPLTFGYLVARFESQQFSAETLNDPRTWWLGTAVLFMAAALMASLSRSGLFGGAAALLVFTLLARRRLKRTALTGLLVGAGAVVVIGLMFANVTALMERISATVPSNLGGRLEVWRETWPMARDFRWAGVGVGAFERAMLVYQQSTRLIFFNHAHNEYLQVLVEGGVILAVAAGLAAAAACVGALARLQADRTPVFWIRAGAASAMAAVAAQNLWDTGLRMPANAVLFAIVAAVALHVPEQTGVPESDPRERRKERQREEAVGVAQRRGGALR